MSKLRTKFAPCDLAQMTIVMSKDLVRETKIIGVILVGHREPRRLTSLIAETITSKSPKLTSTRV